MFGLLAFPGAAWIGEAEANIAMRETAIFAVRKHSDIVTSFGADSWETLARFIDASADTHQQLRRSARPSRGGFERIHP